MHFHKILQHTNWRIRDIYGAQGWGKTRLNFFISMNSTSRQYQM